MTGTWAARVTARRRAFSLMELMVVMAVTLLLTGLMLPALVEIRENSHRVVCKSNLRQVGLALRMFADESGRLPDSVYGAQPGNKSEMMAAHRGGAPENWEGLGWLYADLYQGRFITSPEVFYCPSHHGEHSYDRYREMYQHPGGDPIYTNYHYAGPIDWERGMRRRLDFGGDSIVLATDGLRSVRDFNHCVGMNVLRSDISVNWRSDITNEVIHLLSAGGPVTDDDTAYSRIWELIENE